MQREGMVVLVLAAGLAVLVAVALKGGEAEPAPVEAGAVREAIERPPEPAEATPDPPEPEPAPVGVTEPVEEVGEVPVGGTETEPPPEGAQILAPPARDLTLVKVTFTTKMRSNVADILQRIADDNGFAVEFAPGTRERLEGAGLSIDFRQTGLEEVLSYLGTVSHTRLEIRDGKVIAGDFR